MFSNLLWYVFVWPFVFAFNTAKLFFAFWFTSHEYDQGDTQEDCIGTLAALFGVLITQGISLTILEQTSEVRRLSFWVYLGLSVFTLLSIAFLISISKPPANAGGNSTFYFGKGSVWFGRYLFFFGCVWVGLIAGLAWFNSLPLQVSSKEYIFKNQDQGAAILFPTAIEQESIDMGLDRLLTVKWDDSVNQKWTNVRVKVFSDPDMKTQLSKKTLTRPKVKNHQFYQLYRCKNQKCWVQVYLEPKDPTVDITAQRRQLELDVQRKKVVVVENRFFPER